MDLASYLLKPVQRMGKYALLLQQLMKMAKGDTEYLRQAESMVRFQLRHGNDLLAMDSLRECDVNLKEQGRLLRQNEFLVWQGKGKKCLRQVFLFEELILFSKARRFPDRTVSTRHNRWLSEKWRFPKNLCLTFGNKITDLKILKLLVFNNMR